MDKEWLSLIRKRQPVVTQGFVNRAAIASTNIPDDASIEELHNAIKQVALSSRERGFLTRMFKGLNREKLQKVGDLKDEKRLFEGVIHGHMVGTESIAFLGMTLDVDLGEKVKWDDYFEGASF